MGLPKALSRSPWKIAQYRAKSVYVCYRFPENAPQIHYLTWGGFIYMYMFKTKLKELVSIAYHSILKGVVLQTNSLAPLQSVLGVGAQCTV